MTNNIHELNHDYCDKLTELLKDKPFSYESKYGGFVKGTVNRIGTQYKWVNTSDIKLNKPDSTGFEFVVVSNENGYWYDLKDCSFEF